MTFLNSIVDAVKTFTAFTILAPIALFRATLDHLAQKHVQSLGERWREAFMFSLAVHVPVAIIQKLSLRHFRDEVKSSKRYAKAQNHVLEYVQKPGFSGYWICRGLGSEPIEPKNADLFIYYIHGGGYVVGNPTISAVNLLCTAEQLSKAGLSVAIFGLEYTLVPKEVFPTQINQALAVYRWVTEELGVPSSKIAIMGESAGGHLAVSLLTALHNQANAPSSKNYHPSKPAYAFLISPWFDLHCSNPKAKNLSSPDVDFKRALQEWGRLTVQNLSEKEKKLYANFAQRGHERGSWKNILPGTVWISAGSSEPLFLHDVLQFKIQAEQDGVDVICEVEKNGRHAWQTQAARNQHTAFLELSGGLEDEKLMDGYKRLAKSMISLVKAREN